MSRKIDTVYERLNHRMSYMESRIENNIVKLQVSKKKKILFEKKNRNIKSQVVFFFFFFFVVGHPRSNPKSNQSAIRTK